MDSRLSTIIANGAALFIIAYAQTTPIFLIFGSKPNIALAFAIALAFLYTSFYECAFLVICGALGLASGVGVWQATLFFTAIFILTRGVRLVLPWQPILSGIVLTLSFSFLTYASFDWQVFARLAPQFMIEAFFNAVVFMVLYVLMPRHYAERRRY